MLGNLASTCLILILLFSFCIHTARLLSMLGFSQTLTGFSCLDLLPVMAIDSSPCCLNIDARSEVVAFDAEVHQNSSSDSFKSARTMATCCWTRPMLLVQSTFQLDPDSGGWRRRQLKIYGFPYFGRSMRNLYDTKVRVLNRSSSACRRSWKAIPDLYAILSRKDFAQGFVEYKRTWIFWLSSTQTFVSIKRARSKNHPRFEYSHSVLVPYYPNTSWAQERPWSVAVPVHFTYWRFPKPKPLGHPIS